MNRLAIRFTIKRLAWVEILSFEILLTGCPSLVKFLKPDDGEWIR